jgi:hypothetical protein
MNPWVGLRFRRDLIKLTDLGTRVIIALMITMVYGVWLRDLFIIVLGVAGFLYLAFWYRIFRGSAKLIKEIKVEPSVLDIRAVAGKESSEMIKIECPSGRRYDLSFDQDRLHAEPDKISKGMNDVELVYTPVLGGVKKLREFKLKTADRYGLIELTDVVHFEVTLTSVPRVYPLAAYALRTLGEMSQIGEETISQYIIGSGIEYAESREYTPGDPLRRFDWKAWAKTGKPMVKQYFAEEGGGVCVLYDNVADNPVSLDELNHAFLSLVLSLVERENTEIRLLDDEGIVSYDLDRFNTLLVATQIALQGKIRDFMEYYALLDPVAGKTEFMDSVLNKDINPTSGGVESDNNIIVTSLTGNPSKLLRVIEDLNQPTSLLVPTKPWIWMNSLEKSHKSYEAYIRLVKRLEKRGLRIYSSIDNLF